MRLALLLLFDVRTAIASRRTLSRVCSFCRPLAESSASLPIQRHSTSPDVHPFRQVGSVLICPTLGQVVTTTGSFELHCSPFNMDYEVPTYQFLVTKSEMALLHNLRGMVPEEETEEDKRKLRPPLQLMAFAGDRHLGDFAIDGMNLISDCANIGVELRDTILNVQPQTDNHEDSDVEGEACAASSTHECNDDCEDEPVPSWEEVRARVVPSYVQNVAFIVSKHDLNQERRDDLEERFPDVLVQESGSNISVKCYGCAEQPLEKPSGMKSAVFELEKDHPSILETSLRKQYPWARIKLPYVPNGRRAHQDIENHLQDFAEYMTECPQDTEFDVPMDQTLFGTLSRFIEEPVLHMLELFSTVVGVKPLLSPARTAKRRGTNAKCIGQLSSQTTTPRSNLI